MSWSPNPLDYDRYGKGAANALPSHRQRYGGGGQSKKRRKNGEDIEMSALAPAPSGQAAENYSAVSISPTDEFFDEFTYKDIEALKELNCCMARKKEIRLRLIADEGKVAGQSKWSSDAAVQWRRFKENATDTLNRTKLWESSLHEIEGRFGTSIRSYFAFLRWLFLLNFYIFFLVFLFIVVPTISFENLSGSSDIVSTITPERNVSEACAYNPYNPNAINNFPQYIIWWFTGQGFMENTLLFYGYYDNAATVIQTSSTYFFYNIPLAYLLVSFFYFLLSLVLVVRKAAYGLQETISLDDRFHTYCNRVFSGWDYCINDIRAAHLKHKNIKHELEVDLEEDKIRERQANRTRREKAILYTKRFFINFVVIVLLVASLVAIFFAAQYALQNGSTFEDNFFVDLIVTYLTSIVITVANFIAPVLFGILVKYEDYSPDFTIRLTLIRTVVLRLASIVFLYVVVYLQINCNRYNFVRTPFMQECGYCEGVQCWETYLGQEMYKLTLLDFFIVIAVTLFVEFPRKLVVEHSKCGLSRWVGYQEFDIPKTVLDLVYAQTVAWIGTFYAPMLPVMVVVKFFVFFYLKKLTLMYNCRPAARPYRTSRAGTFFYIILLFGFAVAVFPIAISVSIITPSLDCGPFRSWPYMFYAVTSSILTLPTWAQEMFWFFGSSGFAAVIIVLLCLVLYYFYAASSAHKSTIRLLKNQLTLEGKDKQFLLKRVTQLGDVNYSRTGSPRGKAIPMEEALPGQAQNTF